MTSTDKKKLFVAMPFKPEYTRVLNTIKKASELLQMEVVQVGEQAFAGSIISFIRSAIEEATVVAAIVSEENGNVYYEIGLAHCQRRPVVLLTDDARNLKFDLRDHRAIIYDPKQPEAIKDELVKTIGAAVRAIDASDPEAFVLSAFGKPGGKQQTAVQDAIDRAALMVAQQAKLQEPWKVVKFEITAKGRDLAIELQDFLGDTISAIVDINGFVRKWVRRGR